MNALLIGIVLEYHDGVASKRLPRSVLLRTRDPSPYAEGMPSA